MSRTARFLLGTVTFNAAIAGVLTLLMPSMSIWQHLVYAYSIGLTIAFVSRAIYLKTPPGGLRIAILTIALPISVAVGLTVAQAVTGRGTWGDPHVWRGMAVGLFFGAIGAIVFVLSERIASEVRQRELIRSESERRAIEAHLKLLQAQIEPHFLFNTLANASSLIDTDPALAKHLLERLNDWLRVALARTRSDRASLGDELDMLENYLRIMQIRFGERLRWRLDVSDEARRSSFPPMLLQPLVENAVRHGIEPRLDGGEIRIGSRIDEGELSIEVVDTGVGLGTPSDFLPTTGTGLANVGARLATLFGDAGRLTLTDNADGGTTATLTVPLEGSSA
jgi:sensor histidine kinase YesM